MFCCIDEERCVVLGWRSIFSRRVKIRWGVGEGVYIGFERAFGAWRGVTLTDIDSLGT